MFNQKLSRRARNQTSPLTSCHFLFVLVFVVCRDARVGAPSPHLVGPGLLLLPAGGLEWAGLRLRLPVAAD